MPAKVNLVRFNGSPSQLGSLAGIGPDTVPPATAASIASPNVSGWYNSDFTVALNATDRVGGSAVKQITYSTSGAQAIASTTVAGSMASVSITTEGTTTLSFYATDNAGNVEAANTVVVNLDKTAPIVGLDPSNSLPAYTNQPSVIVAGSATDARSGILSAQLSVVGANTQTIPLAPDMSGNIIASVAVGLPGDGAYNIGLQATDRAGNMASTPIKTVVLDTIPPVVTISSPLAGSSTGSATVSLTYAVADANPTVVEVYVAGTAVQTVSFPAGGTSPMASTTLSLPASGNTTITVVATDLAGNTSSAQVTIFQDPASPVLSINIPDGTRYGPLGGDAIAFSLGVSDLGSTHIATSFGPSPADLPRGGGVWQGFISLVEGVNSISFAVTNEVGLVSFLTRAITYDKTPPNGSITSPVAGSFTRGTVNLSATVQDATTTKTNGTFMGTGVTSVRFSVDGAAAISASLSPGNLWIGSVDTTSLGDGAHTVTATMTDGVGNTAATANQPFAVDNSPPAVSITAPITGSFARQSINITTSASDATSGLASVSILVGTNAVGSCIGATAGGCSIAFDTTTLPDGLFTITATALDNAGNTSAPAQITVTADNSAPKNFLVSPLSGQIATTSMNVAVNVSDVYFASVECFVDGVSLGVSTSPSFRKSVSLLGKLDGASVVSCSARDQAGNMGTQSVTVNIKNWTERMRPHQFELGSHGDAVRLLVRNVDPNVGNAASVLLPIAGKGLALSLPCVPPVPAYGAISPKTRDVQDDGDKDNDADDPGLSRVLLKFSRPAFASSLKSAVQAKCIDPSKPVLVTFVAGGHVIGTDTIVIRNDNARY